MSKKRGIQIAALATIVTAAGASAGRCADPPDPLLDLFVKKGFVTQDEANAVKAEADALRTNQVQTTGSGFKWKISKGMKDIELFGDTRLRYEDRTVLDPVGGKIDLNRLRVAVRLGLRGDIYDDFYYGLRLETSANPRSPWVTLGTASSGTTYQGPFGKSTDGINIGMAYFGWHPTSWLDITLGKMPQPLYTTPMVWDGDLNPEGAAEHLKYTVGQADFWANFTQFTYADLNPNEASGGLGFNGLTGQNTANIFQFAWQGGFTFHINTNASVKAGATLYKYEGLIRSTLKSGTSTSPFFGDPFVGEGAYTGLPGSHNGASGFGTSGILPGFQSVGFPNNQVGLNDLTVLEVPFELTYKFPCVDTRLFGDFGYNFDGKKRAEAAAAGYKVYLSNQGATIPGFSPQVNEDKAYQVGLAVASPDNLGMVYGATSHKHGWEARAYWQHVDQYALDPNLLDSDFFEGRGNLEGFYASIAYGLADNFIATFHYGYATRINDKIGTGGSNLDIPQVNPIQHYNLLQLDLTLRF
jgi:hypothetical protein